MSKRILLINGPNLNLLGQREKSQYGSATLNDVEELAQQRAESLGLELEAMQSNHEGVLIDAIHDAREWAAAIIINAGAFSHYSYAILDALNAYEGLVIEVHISNIHNRENFRDHSVIAARANGQCIGMGVHGYALAVEHIAYKLSGGE